MATLTPKVWGAVCLHGHLTKSEQGAKPPLCQFVIGHSRKRSVDPPTLITKIMWELPFPKTKPKKEWGEGEGMT